MAASNDNRRARKKRGRARGPESIEKMAQVLAEIYAHPPNAVVNHQIELFASLEDEQRTPASNGA